MPHALLPTCRMSGNTPRHGRHITGAVAAQLHSCCAESCNCTTCLISANRSANAGALHASAGPLHAKREGNKEELEQLESGETVVYEGSGPPAELVISILLGATLVYLVRLLLQATLLCWRLSVCQRCLWSPVATDYCQHWQKALAEDYIHRQKVWSLELHGKPLHACMHNMLRFTAIPCMHTQHGTLLCTPALDTLY